MRQIARELHAELQVNRHGRPSRDIVWRDTDNIVRKLEFVLTFHESKIGWRSGNFDYNLALHAWRDAPEGRLL